MKTYYKKAIVSGHVIEIYQYEKPVYSDYELNKIRQHEGRRQEASEDNKLSYFFITSQALILFS
jgi:hypothetical protein